MIVIISSLAIMLTAETSGEYGFQLLKIASGPEGASQAGTGAFSSGEAYAFMLNPTAGSLCIYVKSYSRIICRS